jgi:hypothetical protein
MKTIDPELQKLVELKQQMIVNDYSEDDILAIDKQIREKLNVMLTDATTKNIDNLNKEIELASEEGENTAIDKKKAMRKEYTALYKLVLNDYKELVVLIEQSRKLKLACREGLLRNKKGGC